MDPNRSKCFQLVKRRMECGWKERLGLLCYLTDYMVSAVVSPGLVNIFPIPDKVGCFPSRILYAIYLRNMHAGVYIVHFDHFPQPFRSFFFFPSVHSFSSTAGGLAEAFYPRTIVLCKIPIYPSMQSMVTQNKGLI